MNLQTSGREIEDGGYWLVDATPDAVYLSVANGHGDQATVEFTPDEADELADEMTAEETAETVELPVEAVEKVLKELETGQRQGEISLSHNKVRPSVHMMAMACQDAYCALVEAHPDYELTKGENG